MSGLNDIVNLTQAAATGRILDNPPSEEEIEAALKRAVDAFSLSPTDEGCMTRIDQSCKERRLFSLPVQFPSQWSYPRSFTFVPLPYKLLPETKFRTMVPVLHGADAEKLGEREADRRHFWNMLVASVPQIAERSPWDLYGSSGGKIRILDVGCGRGWAADPLLSYFDRKPYGIPGDALRVGYLGIDIDSWEIERAEKENEKRSNLMFMKADATQFEDYPLLSTRKFDVILIRHPVVFERDYFNHINPMWYKIFKEALEHLAPGGLLIVTAYNCVEFSGADRALDCLGARRVFAAQNPFSANIVLYGRGHNWRDAYVGFYTRKMPDGAPIKLPNLLKWLKK